MALRDSTLAILAGGGGLRLGGVPKGLLEIDATPILSRLLQVGEGFAETLLVTPEPSHYAAFAVQTVGDQVPGRGAPGGIHAALLAARTERIFAVGCDMPFVTAMALERLEARGSDAPLACFEVNGRLEPLLGVYSRGLAPRWERLLGSGPSLKGLFQVLGGRVLPEGELREVDPLLRSVVSLNTPDDLRRWRASLPSGRKSARFPSGG